MINCLLLEELTLEFLIVQVFCQWPPLILSEESSLCFHSWVMFSKDIEFGVECFTSSTLKMFHCLPASHCFWWAVSNYLNHYFFMCHFSLPAFKVFSLSLVSAFDSVIPRHAFLYIYFAWVSLILLNLEIHVFHQFLIIISSNCVGPHFLSPFLGR